jgi:hypothetical protein
MEDDRVSILEAQLAQAKMIAEEADKKYEEVRKSCVSTMMFVGLAVLHTTGALLQRPDEDFWWRILSFCTLFSVQGQITSLLHVVFPFACLVVGSPSFDITEIMRCFSSHFLAFSYGFGYCNCKRNNAV